MMEIARKLPKYTLAIGETLLFIVIFLPFYRANGRYWGSIFEDLYEMRFIDYSDVLLKLIMYLCGLVLLFISMLTVKRKLLIRFIGSILCTISLTPEIVIFMRKQPLVVDIYSESTVELAYGVYVYIIGIILLWASLIMSKLLKKERENESLRL
jgi:hypothetical protein